MKAENKELKLLIIYPWPGALRCTNGAALRLSLLTKFLKPYFDTITILYSGKLSTKIDNVYYKSFKQTKFDFLISRIIRKILKISLGITKKDRPIILHIWLCFRYLFDLRMRKIFRTEIKQCDLIILKYYYFAPFVLKEAKKNNKKVIVADYDVTAEQATGKKLKNAIFTREINALKRADIPVVLSLHDKEVFEKAGVPNIRIIPNGIDCDRTSSLKCSRLFLFKVLKDFFNVKIDDNERICLFVGSKIPPNIVAVKHIKEFASKYSELFPEEKVKFIIVGSCCPKFEEKNIISLGFIKSVLLHFLYQLTDLILIPLEFGTGSSLKTVEAFSYGKLIIGTDVAFRGIEVSSGVNCIVENIFERYPYLINQFINNNSAKKVIENNALLLGKSKDYKISNKGYLEFFKELGFLINECGTLNNDDEINEKIDDYKEININSVKTFFPDSIEIMEEKIADSTPALSI